MKKLIICLFLVTLPVFAGDTEPLVENDIRQGILQESSNVESDKKRDVKEKVINRKMWETSGVALWLLGAGMAANSDTVSGGVLSGLVAGAGIGIFVRSCYDAWTERQ